MAPRQRSMVAQNSDRPATQCNLPMAQIRRSRKYTQTIKNWEDHSAQQRSTYNTILVFQPTGCIPATWWKHCHQRVKNHRWPSSLYYHRGRACHNGVLWYRRADTGGGPSATACYYSDTLQSSQSHRYTIYETMEEFNVDWKAEWSA